MGAHAVVRQGHHFSRRLIGPEMEAALWVLTHEDLRHTPRVRAFTDFAAEALRKYRLLLEGEHVPSNQLETRAPSNRRARVIELTAGASSSQSR